MSRAAPAETPSLRTARQRRREDLRDRILDAAAAIVAADGAGALTMRRLATALECAPMSLYSYFGDKHALLLGLAQRSFAALAARLDAGPDGPPLDALRLLFLTYARFGIDHPDDYRTMFMTPEAQPDHGRKTREQMRSENPAFAAGFRCVAACVEDGLLAGDPHAITTLLWTAVHGAVAALLAFPAFPFGDAAQYAERSLDLTLAALQATRTPPLQDPGPCAA